MRDKETSSILSYNFLRMILQANTTSIYRLKIITRDHRKRHKLHTKLRRNNGVINNTQY